MARKPQSLPDRAGSAEAGYDEAEWALIKAAQAGDEAAFTKLLAPYLYIIYAIIREKVPQKEVEDLVQQVYLAVWVGLSGYRGTGSFKAWLRSVASRVVAGYHRHAGSTVVVDFVRRARDNPGAQEALERAEDRAIIGEALVRLPPRHRAVLLLHLHEGLPFAEVGKRLRLSEGAARVLYNRARAKLRQVEV